MLPEPTCLVNNYLKYTVLMKICVVYIFSCYLKTVADTTKVYRWFSVGLSTSFRLLLEPTFFIV